MQRGKKSGAAGVLVGALAIGGLVYGFGQHSEPDPSSTVASFAAASDTPSTNVSVPSAVSPQATVPTTVPIVVPPPPPATTAAPPTIVSVPGPVTTVAPAPQPAPVVTVAPPPPPAPAPQPVGGVVGTAPILRPPSGGYYRAGEFCPHVDAGKTTQDAQGGTLICVDNNGLRWEHA